MKIEILTLFPKMFAPLKASIIGRAKKDRKIEINIIDIRNYTKNKHKKCDDYTFGGGAGMVMTAKPIASAIQSIDPNHRAHRVYMSPKGKVFTQGKAKIFSKQDHLIILCGHYEGVDQRAIDLFIDEEVSIGDYILTGGELAAMVVTDCVARLCDGVISKASLDFESLEDGLLEYPHYTRPIEFMGISVPEILRSGDHQKIADWRKQQSLEITKKNRPDLLNGNK